MALDQSQFLRLPLNQLPQRIDQRGLLTNLGRPSQQPSRSDRIANAIPTTPPDKPGLDLPDLLRLQRPHRTRLDQPQLLVCVFRDPFDHVTPHERAALAQVVALLVPGRGLAIPNRIFGQCIGRAFGEVEIQLREILDVDLTPDILRPAHREPFASLQERPGHLGHLAGVDVVGSTAHVVDCRRRHDGRVDQAVGVRAFGAGGEYELVDGAVRGVVGNGLGYFG